MEWSAPGMIISVAPYGEGDALASIFTEDHGVYRGLARGGLSRARAATWQTGNLVEARWIARLADQLGSYTAELVHPAAALAMQDPLTLSVLTAACAVAEGALPEREPHPSIFKGLLHLIVHLQNGNDGVAALISWEQGLLADLGYGLDLAACAVTGSTNDLAYISPKSGRAVSAAGAGLWRERLLPLPAFLRDSSAPTMEDLQNGLRVTGHFLTRDVFGSRHRALPAARVMLYDRICRIAPHQAPRSLRCKPHTGNSGTPCMLAPIADTDIPAIVELMNRAYRGTGPNAGWTTEAGYIAGDRTTEELLRAELAASPNASLLKWEAGQNRTLQGCVWLESLEGGIWYLGSLTIDPDKQQGGLGRTLLAAAEHWVTERGGKCVRLTVVNVRETLIDWYIRRGYHRTGKTNPFPYGDNRFGTPLREDLSFVVLEKPLPQTEPQTPARQ